MDNLLSGKNILKAVGIMFSGIGVYLLDKYWDSLQQLILQKINYFAIGLIILFLFIVIAIFGVKKFRKARPIQKSKSYLKENLGCKEKLDKEVWDILQKIKTNIFHTKKGDFLVKYKKTFTKFTEEYEQEESILEKIEDMGAIKIIKAGDAPGYLHEYIMNNPATSLTEKNLDMSRYMGMDSIFLHIFSKFDEIYKKYENKFIKK